MCVRNRVSHHRRRAAWWVPLSNKPLRRERQGRGGQTSHRISSTSLEPLFPRGFGLLFQLTLSSFSLSIRLETIVPSLARCDLYIYSEGSTTAHTESAERGGFLGNLSRISHPFFFPNTFSAKLSFETTTTHLLFLCALFRICLRSSLNCQDKQTRSTEPTNHRAAASLRLLSLSLNLTTPARRGDVARKALPSQHTHHVPIRPSITTTSNKCR